MSMTDLAGHMGVTVATMSLAIDRLERKGYVRRDRDPQDRRRVLLRATAAGIRIREAKSVLDPARVEQELTNLSAADLKTALKGLQLLARASAQHMRGQKGK
jgi:DNA-binding MarR family transcriptional regulator